MLDNVPDLSPVAPCIISDLMVSSGEGGPLTIILPAGTVLPAKVTTQVQVGQVDSYLQILASSSTTPVLLAELVFQVDSAGIESPVVVDLLIEALENGEVKVEINTKDKTNLGSVIIPPASA